MRLSPVSNQLSSKAENTSSKSNAPITGDSDKKVFIKTYGCQMNVYDSQRMNDALAKDGYSETQDMEDADLILLNTCHIREKAAEKVYSELGRIRKLKEARSEGNRPVTLGVTGCVAQAEGQEIIRRERSVDLVVGPQTYHQIPQIVRRARDGEKVVQTEFAIEEKFETLPLASTKKIRSRGPTAFLTVQEGCDKFCTFCVVPYTRGAEVSRPVAQILEEAQKLIDSGVREITLLGQNVNAWHGLGHDEREWGLGELLRELDKIEGLDRLRYVTSHPRDMEQSLIDAHRDLKSLMPYLHLPVQAGSDRILKAMNRKHTAAEYIAMIRKIKEARPDIAMSGDFIVGFPGETDQDFEDTLQIVRDTEYAQAFSFKYSPRPGTPGAELEDQVPEDVKSERLQRLQALLNEQQYDFNKGLVGKTIDVLIEKRGKTEGQMIGRSPWLQSVILAGSEEDIGKIIPVKIVHAAPNSLNAEHISA
jgi:tRNA-2-methylthio-N6-dimethylallyladenosine synthase